MAIMKAHPESLLNMHEEFVSKYRHINKFTLWFFKRKKLIKYTSSLFSRDLWDIVLISTSIKTIQFKLSTISSKVVCFKKRLAYQVSKDPQETKYPQPLNVSYHRQTIKFAVGAVTGPLHT